MPLGYFHAERCITGMTISAAVFGFLTLVLDIILIMQHYLSWRNSKVQIWIIIVIICLPIWTTLGFLSVRFPEPRQTPFITLFSDSLEGLFMLAFTMMVVGYIGGWKKLKEISNTIQSSNFYFFTIKPNWIFVWRLLCGVFQFVIVIPLIAICTTATALTDHFHVSVISPNDAWLPLTIIRAISLVVMLLCLLTFYRVVSRSVRGAKLVRKFMVQKLLLGVLVLQSMVLKSLQARSPGEPNNGSSPNNGSGPSNGSSPNNNNTNALFEQVLGLMVCVEMFLFSIVFFFTHTHLNVHAAQQDAPAPQPEEPSPSTETENKDKDDYDEMRSVVSANEQMHPVLGEKGYHDF